MLAFTAWSLVVVSFLLIGVFGYASVGRSSQSVGLSLGRPIIMITAAAISSNYLNTLAYRMFTRIEIDTFKRCGLIQEDQMQPDMPNLMAGLIGFGWAFFVVGVMASRTISAHTEKLASEQDAALKVHE